MLLKKLNKYITIIEKNELNFINKQNILRITTTNKHQRIKQDLRFFKCIHFIKIFLLVFFSLVYK